MKLPALILFSTITAFRLCAQVPPMQHLTSTGAGERMEQIVGVASPALGELNGVCVEISGRYIATADASAVLRVMTQDNRPLTLTWGYYDDFQIGGLPRDFVEMEGARPRAPQTDVTWKLTIRGLKRSSQRVKLETMTAGKWVFVLEKEMALPNLRRQLANSEDITAVVGLAGAVSIENAKIRVFREGSLLILR